MSMKPFHFSFARVLVLLFALTGLHHAYAEEAPAEGAAAAPKAFYVEFDEPIVANFGKVGSHLRYIKATISLRVDSDQGAYLVKYHAAQIRNNLVLLFSRQTEADMKTIEGREKLRQDALLEAQKVLTDEEGKAYITNLLMPSFIVQD